MKTEVIIPMAGSGTRLKSKISKPLIVFHKKPLFFYTVKKFEDSRRVNSIVLVVQKENIAKFKGLVKKFRFKKVKAVVAGGKSRSQSVYNGLKVTASDTDIILVHDGARPFITTKLIDASIDLCRKYPAVIIAVPVKSTIKRVDVKTLHVKETLNRRELWEIQTPQTFKREVLWKAHQAYKKDDATDDAFLVERLGIKVKVLPGSYENIKITTQEDLSVAALFLRKI